MAAEWRFDDVSLRLEVPSGCQDAVAGCKQMKMAISKMAIFSGSPWDLLA
jgi:hypothetical protein